MQHIVQISSSPNSAQDATRLGLIDGGGVSIRSSVAFEPSCLMTACNKFFTTTELLEETMLHLSLQGILKMQRINKSFKAVIKGSGKIRRVIIFTPPGKIARKPYGSSNSRGWYKNGMIATMLFETTTGLSQSGMRHQLVNALNHGCSWKGKSISELPCTHIRYLGAVSGEVHTISNSKGVTFGDVFDSVEQQIPALDRSRKLGPHERRRLYQELSNETTGWDVMVFLQEIFDGDINGG